MPTTLVMPKAYQGDDYSHRIVCKHPVDNEGTITNEPLPIEGAVIGSIKYGEVLVEADLTNSDLPAGLIIFELTSEQTKGLPDEAIYDIQQTLGGKISTLFKGPFYTEAQVTP